MNKKLLKRARSGDAEAQFNLGFMYYCEYGVVRRYKEAARWLRLAAEQGHVAAQYLLGSLYKDGRGVVQDYKEAAGWWRLAAEQGSAGAQFDLGLLYEYGDGVEKNKEEAYFWFLLAATNGDVLVMENRDNLAKELTKEQQERIQERARKWFEEHEEK